MGSRIRTAGRHRCTIPDDNPKSASQHGVTERARGATPVQCAAKACEDPRETWGFFAFVPERGSFFDITDRATGSTGATWL